MKLLTRLLVLGSLAATLVVLDVAMAQTPDNPSRRETTRQREDPERQKEPEGRNNAERLDPLMSAELQKCYAVPEDEKERCITAVKRKFGEM